jgi:UDP-N-acetylglucosamine--N-acetylmuramyl-(pentapeptide) pyrophosphoryl-undecaprenol N-acetylglucosamine transferase
VSTILWYLHDRGRGHLGRAQAVLPNLSAPVVVAAGPHIADAARRGLDVEVVRLPPDTADDCPTPRGPWHHAPAGPLLRSRSLALVDVVARARCTTAVVDVSMEVTTLSCLLGLRTVTVRQSGRRDDQAHRIGLASADVVWVPQHRDLEPLADPTDGRWFFSGPFSRFDAEHASMSPPCNGTRRRVVVVLGGGGSAFDEDEWRRSVPPSGWEVVIAGGGAGWVNGSVSAVGHVEPLFGLLQTADVVITSAGWSAVADVVAAGRPFVAIAEARPFDEQAVRCAALAARGLACTRSSWPSPHDLPGILDEAGALDPAAWAPYHDGAGARRAAAMIDGVHRS